MYLIEILLPLQDNNNNPLPEQLFTEQKKLLADKFGGLTAFTRAPAEGLWNADGNTDLNKDQIIIFEVMCETLDKDWWRNYRACLEEKFQQEIIVVRSHPITKL